VYDKFSNNRLMAGFGLKKIIIVFKI